MAKNRIYVQYSVLIMCVIACSCVTHKSIPIKSDGTIDIHEIVSGDFLRIKLNGGDKIEKFKVLEIDSTRIAGVRTYISPHDFHEFERNETILIKNIKAMKKVVKGKKVEKGWLSGGGLWGVW